jgi:DNA primase
MLTIRGSAGWREVRDRCDLVRVARELLGEPAKRRGNTLYWPCPLHHDTGPSLRITEGTSRWNCWGCRRWGDAVDLVRQVREARFSEALAFLSREEFFFPEDGEIGPGPAGGIDPDESIEVNDNWIDDLLRDVPN